MGVKAIYRFSGYLSIIIGIGATLCISRIQWMYYGVGLALVGLILAIVNIFLNAKYFAEQDRMPKGYFGMFLSSLPIIFLMLIIFKFRK